MTTFRCILQVLLSLLCFDASFASITQIAGISTEHRNSRFVERAGQNGDSESSITSTDDYALPTATLDSPTGSVVTIMVSEIYEIVKSVDTHSHETFWPTTATTFYTEHHPTLIHETTAESGLAIMSTYYYTTEIFETAAVSSSTTRQIVQLPSTTVKDCKKAT
jgi:hypothetical protein